ncbi:hypothetical protein CHS0354_033623, partial [Potamilus streckersoni]
MNHGEQRSGTLRNYVKAGENSPPAAVRTPVQRRILRVVETRLDLTSRLPTLSMTED